MIRRPGLAIAWDIGRVAKRPETVVARRRARLRRLVRYAFRHSAFYAQRYQEVDDPGGRLESLPPVTKPELMTRFDSWVTDPAVTRAGVGRFLLDDRPVGLEYLSRYVVCETSGTTGEPGIFLHDRAAQSVYAALLGFRGWPSWGGPGLAVELLRAGVRVGIVTATGGHYAGLVLIGSSLTRLRVVPAPFRVIPVQWPVRDVAAALEELRPTVLFSYPSMLGLLADEQLAGRLNIHPKLILASAEPLESPTRARIEGAFNRRLQPVYGASEFPYVGFECTERWYHVNADWVILEPVDRAFQPVPAGQPSDTVLLTNLANSIQPLIRYDLGDSVTAREDACPCGNRLPAIRVAGRSDEILTFPTYNGEIVRILPLALVTVAEQSPGVRRCQVVRVGPSRLEVRLDEVAGSDRAVVLDRLARTIRVFLASQGLEHVEVAGSDVRPGPDPRSGKYRAVWSEYS